MIIDRLENYKAYSRLGAGLAAGLRWLAETDLSALAPGRIEIAGPRLYATVSESETRPMGEGLWEAHRQYTDIHCVITGEERIGYAEIAGLKAESYDEEKDVQRFSGAGVFFVLRPGFFAVMMPADAHMPGFSVGRPRALKKVVVKVAMPEKNYKS